MEFMFYNALTFNPNIGKWQFNMVNTCDMLAYVKLQQEYRRVEHFNIVVGGIQPATFHQAG